MAYTAIEYIESTGTQYIDTGYLASDKTRVEISFEIVEFMKEYLFGANKVWKSYDYSVIIDDTEGYGFCFNNGGYYTKINPTLAKELIVTDLSNKIFTLNETNYGLPTVGEYVSNGTMYLFCLNKDGITHLFSKMKVFYMKIWDNGTLVFDLIPVLDENNVACLYNKVTGTYLYNAGTGDFIAGNVIVTPIITIGTPSRTKISAMSGYDQAVVTFQSDMELSEWEARATVEGQTPGHGVGLLVESGSTLAANTDATVYVDNEELTSGDAEYTISIFGKSTDGRWSDE